MEPLTIQVPESWRDFIAEQVARGGHRSADEYVESLLREAELREARDATADFLRSLTPEQNERLEALLQEGLDSGPPIPADETFWEEKRRRLAERYGKGSIA